MTGVQNWLNTPGKDVLHAKDPGSMPIADQYQSNSAVKGPVIIYDQEGAGSNDFLQKIFLRPTQRAKKKKIAAYLTLRENFSMPTLIGRNKQVSGENFLEKFFSTPTLGSLIFLLMPTHFWPRFPRGPNIITGP